MSDLILGYVRITWYMVLFLTHVVINLNLRGKQREQAEDYCKSLEDIGIQLDKALKDMEGAN